MKAVIHADDFGVSYGVNEGIEKAFTKGILTSTSIRTNGPAYEDAIKRIKTRLSHIGLGLHLNLTDGRTHLPALANNQGFYRYSFPQYLLQSSRPHIKKDIYKELDEQFRIARKSGLLIDHVDGQDHIHMIPFIFEIVCQLCVKYDVKYIRLAAEPWYTLPKLRDTLRPIINGGFLKAVILLTLSFFNKELLKKYGLFTTDSYFGVLNTNAMTVDAFTAIVEYASKKRLSTIEIACHPGIPHDTRDTMYTSPFFKFYTNLPSRKMELETLTSTEVKQTFKKRNILLGRFGDLAE